MTDTLSHIFEQARISTRAFFEFGSYLVNPTIRLGVTGMSGAGKTIFITAIIHGLVRGGRFPVFEALAGGRISEAHLAPQPDDAVPRFDYENHIRALTTERKWPESTRQISELRLVIEYQSQRGAMRTLTLDIVDYPGEWLLDLPLLNLSYDQWSAESLMLSRQQPRAALAAKWHGHLKTLNPEGPENEQAVLTASALFTDYLKSCRDQRYAMSMLPPGRFLMPGDAAGSPALTFAPLDLPDGSLAPPNSLWAMMQRRYESYKAAFVQPFFRDHFSRLDRQIVLVDVLSAVNAGQEALADLDNALTSILACFRLGRKSLFSALFSPRIDRILFAAAKADRLHSANHERLEALLRRLVERAAARASFAGSEVDVIALAAVRATREVMINQNGALLPAIVGVPTSGEMMGKTIFNGEKEVAMFPGDLPADPDVLLKDADAFRGLTTSSAQDADYRFLRLLPPALQNTGDGEPSLPHIRLDRALQFLIGDRLQ
jgi:uncharacterized protein